MAKAKTAKDTYTNKIEKIILILLLITLLAGSYYLYVRSESRKTQINQPVTLEK